MLKSAYECVAYTGVGAPAPSLATLGQINCSNAADPAAVAAMRATGTDGLFLDYEPGASEAIGQYDAGFARKLRATLESLRVPGQLLGWYGLPLGANWNTHWVGDYAANDAVAELLRAEGVFESLDFVSADFYWYFSDASPDSIWQWHNRTHGILRALSITGKPAIVCLSPRMLGLAGCPLMPTDQWDRILIHCRGLLDAGLVAGFVFWDRGQPYVPAIQPFLDQFRTRLA